MASFGASLAKFAGAGVLQYGNYKYNEQLEKMRQENLMQRQSRQLAQNRMQMAQSHRQHEDQMAHKGKHLGLLEDNQRYAQIGSLEKAKQEQLELLTEAFEEAKMTMEGDELSQAEQKFKLARDGILNQYNPRINSIYAAMGQEPLYQGKDTAKPASTPTPPEEPNPLPDIAAILADYATGKETVDNIEANKLTNPYATAALDRSRKGKATEADKRLLELHGNLNSKEAIAEYKQLQAQMRRDELATMMPEKAEPYHEMTRKSGLMQRSNNYSYAPRPPAKAPEVQTAENEPDAPAPTAAILQDPSNAGIVKAITEMKDRGMSKKEILDELERINTGQGTTAQSNQVASGKFRAVLDALFS